jgi:hypothetical protein
MMWPETIKDWMETAFYIIGIGAAFASFLQYRQNSVRERAKWLFELYQRFYEQSKLRNMRITLDEHDTQFVQAESDRESLADLDEFLNFFEFLAFLWKSGEIKEQEVHAMFDYPLATIGTDRRVMDYLVKYGYEKLAEMLEKMGYANKKP